MNFKVTLGKKKDRKGVSNPNLKKKSPKKKESSKRQNYIRRWEAHLITQEFILEYLFSVFGGS